MAQLKFKPKVFLNWPSPASFFFIFVYHVQLTVNKCSKKSPMTAFEPRISGVGSDCAANWSTTTAQHLQRVHTSNSFNGNLKMLTVYWKDKEKIGRIDLPRMNGPLEERFDLVIGVSRPYNGKHWTNDSSYCKWLESSVTRLGYFWKVLVRSFLTKVVQIFGNFLANLSHISVQLKTAVATCLATFGEIGLLLF